MIKPCALRSTSSSHELCALFHRCTRAHTEPRAECMLVLIGATPKTRREPTGLQGSSRAIPEAGHPT
jgi:hypothetical protein